MDVRDLMTSDVVVAHPDTPLKDIARLLVEHRISGVPVVDDERRVVGVVSEADFIVKESGADPAARPRLLDRLLGGRRAHEVDEHRLQAVTAGEAMTSPPLTVEAGASVAEAARTMTQASINRLPVVEDGHLVGIISRADLVRTFVRTDEELLADVGHAVRAVDGLSGVTVTDGVATLSGTVSHPAVAESVRRIVAAIPGIVGVDDRDVTWLPEEMRTPILS